MSFKCIIIAPIIWIKESSNLTERNENKLCTSCQSLIIKSNSIATSMRNSVLKCSHSHHKPLTKSNAPTSAAVSVGATHTWLAIHWEPRVKCFSRSKLESAFLPQGRSGSENFKCSSAFSHQETWLALSWHRIAWCTVTDGCKQHLPLSDKTRSRPFPKYSWKIWQWKIQFSFHSKC